MHDCISQLELPTCATEYRYVSAAEVDLKCASPRHEWLSEREQAELSAWRNPNRRQEWLRGRFVAKQLVAAGLPGYVDLRSMEILRRGETRRPCVTIRDEEQTWSISISHSARGVLVAISRQPDISVGADLTCRDDVLSFRFVQLWFSAAEIAWLHEQAPPFAANTIWATKEAIFKACNRGEGFDPRRIEVLPDRLSYRGKKIDYQLQRRVFDNQVAVVVTVNDIESPQSM